MLCFLKHQNANWIGVELKVCPIMGDWVMLLTDRRWCVDGTVIEGGVLMVL